MYVKIGEQKTARPAGRKDYTYFTADGTPTVRVVRTDFEGGGKKKIFQQHYLNGEWFNGLPKHCHKNIRLYRIDDLINKYAITRGDPLLMVEGEGKVDLLHGMGIAATCNLGGAGKWTSYGSLDYLGQLEGANLVIVPDRDLPGIQHAEKIAEDFPDAQWLYPFPDSPLWDNPPKKDGLDIADWIADYQLSAKDVLATIGPRRTPPDNHDNGATPETSISVYETPKLLMDYQLIETLMGGRLRFNFLFKQVELDGAVFEPQTAKMELAIKHRLPLRSAKDDVADLVVRLAKENTYKPVEEYLESVAKRHGADTTILEGMAYRYLGTSNPLHQTLLVRFLIGAVARAFKPGCKHDTALILQGEQGIGKSSFFKVLASREWFDDSMGSASSDKDEKAKMHLAWIVEWAELERVFRRSDVSQVKALMSCDTDRIRPPYGRTTEIMQRGCVLAGSTNLLNFLSDPTGDRRFWVIPVTKAIDTETLAKERDRIWAAAVALYRQGHIWHLEPGEERQAAEDRAVYRDDDPWLVDIESYCSGRTVVSTGEILTQVLGLEIAKHDHAAKIRVTKVLTQLGWKTAQNPQWHLGKKQRVWILPERVKTAVPAVPGSANPIIEPHEHGTVYGTVMEQSLNNCSKEDQEITGTVKSHETMTENKLFHSPFQPNQAPGKDLMPVGTDGTDGTGGFQKDFHPKYSVGSQVSVIGETGCWKVICIEWSDRGHLYTVVKGHRQFRLVASQLSPLGEKN